MNKRVSARLALLVATVIWGSSFVVLKNTLDSLPILFILAFRFLVAGCLLSVVFWKKLSAVTPKSLASGALTGACLFMAYYLQTIGLANTTPGKNAFLTSVYCIIVPFLYWAVDRKRPDRYNIIAAISCLTGIGFVSLTESFTVQMGDYMTLISGFFWAAHIILIAKFSGDTDPVLLTILQFFACGLIAAVGSVCVDTLPVGWFSGAWRELLYMAVFCTGVTLLCQNWGQSHLPPANAAILLSLESVFGVIFSVMIYGEKLTPRLVVGFCLIFAATIISETKLSFLTKKEAVPK
ncbi:MAG: DMT family transporter [Clostridia bacterium]|nr:DMT family transporter [Clostridia bacterium]